MTDVALTLTLAMLVWAVVDFLRIRDAYDWRQIEDDLWKREMRDKYPWRTGVTAASAWHGTSRTARRGNWGRF